MALNSRFSEIGFCGVLDASCFPCENWESVNKGAWRCRICDSQNGQTNSACHFATNTDSTLTRMSVLSQALDEKEDCESLFV